MPGLVLGFASSGAIARLLQAGLQDTLSAPFVLAARARGFRNGPRLLWHALRPALPPVISLVAVEAAGQGAVATFRLSDTAESRSQWDHAFLAELTVAIGGDKLSVTLAISNTGAGPFDFTAALHTYLAVADISATTVTGLAGLKYRDAAAGGVTVHEDSPQFDFPEEVNRIYFDAPAEARLVEKDRITVVEKAGFADTVVWNPGAAKIATMSDLEPEDYRRFVCVEAAAVGAPIQLAPGERWQGMQTLIV